LNIKSTQLVGAVSNIATDGDSTNIGRALVRRIVATVEPELGLAEQWDELIDRLDNANLSRLLSYCGVDVLDVMVSPIYLGLLTVRSVIRTASKKDTLLTATRFSNRIAARWHSFTEHLRALLASKEPCPGSLIFWPREPTHLQVQVPVALDLAARGANFCFFSIDPTFVPKVVASGMNCFYGRGSWCRKLRCARMEGERVKRMLGDARTIWDGLHVALLEALLKSLPHAFESIVAASELVARNPGLLVVGNDLTIDGRAAVRAAKNAGVRTATMMHGALVGSPLHGCHIVDRILVYGNKHRHDLAAFGFPEDRISVCGAPYLDQKLGRDQSPPSDIRSFLKLSPGEKYVLIATSGPGHTISHAHHLRTIEILMELSNKWPDLKFVAKLHRKDRLSFYDEVRSRHAGSLIVVPNDHPSISTDIFDWLKGAVVVLTGASTTAIEAMALGIPVITMDFASELKNVDFIDEGATLHATTTQELEEKLRASLNHLEIAARSQVIAREFVREQFYQVDGKSAARCAATLQTIVERSPAMGLGNCN
jgi:hypothetical protein